MFDHIDAALSRLYPTRRWGELDERAALGGGIGEAEGRALAAELAGRLSAATFFRAGGPEEYCDFIYILCQGREPCLVAVREPGVGVPEELAAPPVHELYLRLCLSTLARMAAVQQTAISLEGEEGALVLSERPRTGVWDAPLLPRLQKLVAVLGERGIVHLDYGDIYAPPAGFDSGEYRSLYGAEPDIANYLFYPQPSNAVSTCVLAASEASIHLPANPGRPV